MAHIAGSWEVVMVVRSDGHQAADVRPLVRVSITVIMEEGRAAASKAAQAAAGVTITAGSVMSACRNTRALPVHQAQRQSGCRSGAGGHHAGRARAWAGRASCSTRPSVTAWRATSTARAVRRFRAASASRSRPGVSPWWMTARYRIRRGSLSIDDEGNPSERTVLIEDGVLTGLHAGHDERAPDGHAGRPATVGASLSPICRCRA
jgi:TldD protein